MRKGKKVFIQELNQFGRVDSLTEKGGIHTVSVVTADGVRIVDVIEKGFNVATLISAILGLILKFLKGRDA